MCNIDDLSPEEINSVMSDGSTLLNNAVNAKDLCLVSQIIMKGASVNVMDGKGRTPLALSCRYRYNSATKMLLKAGARVDIPDRDTGLYPLHISIWHRNTCHVRELLKFGADPNKLLKGETLINYVCKNNYEKIIDDLIRAGADPTIRDKNGNRPEDILRSNGSKVYLSTLLSLCKQRELINSIGNKNINELDNGTVLLHTACKNNFSWVVDFLIGKDVDVNIVDGDGNTPLLIVCSNGYHRIAKKLLDAGAKTNISNPNAPDLHPLHIAIKKGSFWVIKELLRDIYETDPNKTLNGLTPLMYAFDTNSGPMTIHNLVEATDPNIKNKDGEIAMDFAIRSKFRLSIEDLIYKGDPELITESINRQSPYEINREVRGKTLLHSACDIGDRDLVNTLLKKRADTEALDWEGNTPLAIVCIRSYPDLVSILVDAGAKTYLGTDNINSVSYLLHFAIERKHCSLVRKLLKYGADPNYEKEGLTPLMTACNHISKGMMPTLIKNNANLNIKNNKGETVMDYVISCGESAIVSLILALEEAIEKESAHYNVTEIGDILSSLYKSRGREK